MVGNDYVGAVGGQVDFVRAACQSPGGRSIIALPSTAKKNSTSRIVARLSGGVTTTPRSDADVVVTEWGAAELRGQTLSARVRRIIAIAHPDIREPLEREVQGLLWGGIADDRGGPPPVRVFARKRPGTQLPRPAVAAGWSGRMRIGDNSGIHMPAGR
jgi:acyl-CoA hydrolase